MCSSLVVRRSRQVNAQRNLKNMKTKADTELLTTGKEIENSPIGESQNTENKKNLDRCEEIIRQNEKSGIIIGRNLSQINDQLLYKADGFNSFDIYCKERWGMSGSHAHRLINGAKYYDVLASHKTEEKWILPRNEAQIRPLTTLHEKELVPTWTKIMKKFAGKAFTAEDIDDFLNPGEKTKSKGANVKDEAKAVNETAAEIPAKKLKDSLEKIEKLVSNALAKKTDEDAIPIMKFRKFLEKIKKLIEANK